MIGGSKLDECWRVIRDHGWVRPRDVAAVTGYSEHRIAPLLWWLTKIGWAVERHGQYASARTFAINFPAALPRGRADLHERRSP